MANQNKKNLVEEVVEVIAETVNEQSTSETIEKMADMSHEIAVTDDSTGFYKSLEEAGKIDTTNLFRPTADGKSEVAHAEYEVMNAKGEVDTFETFSPFIISTVERLKALDKMGDVIAFQQCRLLAVLKNSDDFKKTEFRSLTAFCNSIGIMSDKTSSTINAYAKIGEVFLKEDGTLRDGLPKKLTIGHMLQLTGQVKEKLENGDWDISPVISLYEQNVLVAGMSVGKLKKALSDNAKKALPENASNSESGEEKSETVETVESKTETLTGEDAGKQVLAEMLSIIDTLETKATEYDNMDYDGHTPLYIGSVIQALRDKVISAGFPK